MELVFRSWKGIERGLRCLCCSTEEVARLSSSIGGLRRLVRLPADVSRRKPKTRQREKGAKAVLFVGEL